MPKKYLVAVTMAVGLWTAPAGAAAQPQLQTATVQASGVGDTSGFDGVVEAIEFQGRDHFALGVQWHPELMLDSVPPNLGIYRAFVNKARDRRH